MATGSDEKYVANHRCECDNRYDERPPFCLGVINAPDNKRSRETFAYHMYKQLCLGVDGKGRHIKVGDIKFLEVRPSEAPAKKICTGHLNEGYPIVRLEKEYEKIIFIQRLHRKTGNWRKPACGKTHAVLMIYQRRQEGKCNNDPITSEEAYLQLTPLIGNAEPRLHASTGCKANMGLKCSHNHIIWDDPDKKLHGRSFNFGCSYNYFNNRKYMEGSEIVLGGGCNFMTSNNVDKFGDIR